MNDRIKQLIMEAVNFRLDPDSDAYEAQICPEDLEYLAELIVRECASIVEAQKESLCDNENDWSDRDYGYEQAVNDSVDMIKQHFGVEE